MVLEAGGSGGCARGAAPGVAAPVPRSPGLAMVWGEAASYTCAPSSQVWWALPVRVWHLPEPHRLTDSGAPDTSQAPGAGEEEAGGYRAVGLENKALGIPQLFPGH